MTNYEREMFNIAVPPDASIESQLKAYTDTNCVDAFKMGHRAARHRAAEIAYDADVDIAELQAKLRAWEETAEHYCKADTPISPDGVRGYIAELEAQLAAKDARIAALEAQLGGDVFTRTQAAINELGLALGVK